MWQLNGPAANYLLACIVFLLVFSLIFSFRDTIRALAEFFDIRAIRRLFRKPLATAILLGFLVVLACLSMLFEDLRDFGLAIALAGLFLVPGLSLSWLVVTDASEVYGRRKRRRQFLRERGCSAFRGISQSPRD